MEHAVMEVKGAGEKGKNTPKKAGVSLYTNHTFQPLITISATRLLPRRTLFFTRSGASIQSLFFPLLSDGPIDHHTDFLGTCSTLNAAPDEERS